jgi:hypothetical protein
MRITIKLTQAMLKRDALLAQGISPQAYGQRKTSQPHRNRRADVRRGIVKHKAQALA